MSCQKCRGEKNKKNCGLSKLEGKKKLWQLSCQKYKVDKKKNYGSGVTNIEGERRVKKIIGSFVHCKRKKLYSKSMSLHFKIQIVKNILIPCHSKKKIILFFFSNFGKPQKLFFSLPYIFGNSIIKILFFPTPLWQLHCLNSFFFPSLFLSKISANL